MNKRISVNEAKLLFKKDIPIYFICYNEDFPDGLTRINKSKYKTIDNFVEAYKGIDIMYYIRD
jgi:hypothetical protein